MNDNDILDKLRFRRSKLLEELGQQIAHIEELSAVIQRLGGETQRPPTFPPTNPFQGVPQQRIDTQSYLRIARTLISDIGDTQGIQRVPGAESPALIVELSQRIREINHIIHGIDQDIERLETQASNGGRADNIQAVIRDRDRLAAEVQFYRDLKEALEHRPTRATRQEVQEQRDRARDWAEARRGRR